MGLRWMQGGFHGVTVLFVLAGYLATAGLIREFRRHDGTIDLVGYWLRRLRRLMPTVIVFIIVTAAACSLFNHVMLTKMRPDIVPGILMYLNWSKIFRAEDYFAQAGSPSPLTHFWTLAIEWQFYLVLPPVLYLLLRKKVSERTMTTGFLALTLASAALMVVLYAGGSGASRAYYGTDTRAMSLLLGCALALLWPFDATVGRSTSQLKSPAASLVGPLGAASVVILIILMVVTDGYSGFTYLGGTLLVSVLALVAIASCVPQDTIAARVLALRPLTWIGERSYAIYVWHYPIIELLTKRNAAVATPIWRYGLMLAVTLAAAALSYELVEKPFRKRTVKEVFGDTANHALEGLQTLTAGTIADRLRVGAQFAGGLALIVTCVGAAYGIATIPAVNALGDTAGAPRVSKATLRKPLTDGVYDVIFIGDSVGLGASEQLNAAFPHGVVNVEGSREADAALEVFREYEAQGVVGDMVVMHVGTNGILTDDIMEEIVDEVGPDRDLWLVNDRVPDNRMQPNNECIQRCVDAHENVHLIDWAAETEGHPEYLDPDDGIHLTYEGRDAYGALVPRAMNYTPANSANTHYDVTLIGDEVALSAVDELSSIFVYGVVDCAEGRDPAKLVDTYQSYEKDGLVGEHVVLCLGGDLALTKGHLDKLLDAIGTEHTVWLVNTRTANEWCATSNDSMSAAASERSNVNLIDWYQLSDGQSGWFTEDGTILTKEGAGVYAQTIKDAMGYDPAATEKAANATEEGDENSEETEETGYAEAEAEAGAAAETTETYDSSSDETYADDGSTWDTSYETTDETAYDYGYDTSSEDGTETYDSY